MNPIWLPASLFGGLFQAWRTALQQRLRAELSISGAGLVRYLYGVPFALGFAAIWLTIRGDAVPALGAAFAGFALAGAITQMAGTILLIMAFGHRGFVVGTAFSKTEAVPAILIQMELHGLAGFVPRFDNAELTTKQKIIRSDYTKHRRRIGRDLDGTHAAVNRANEVQVHLLRVEGTVHREACAG